MAHSTADDVPGLVLLAAATTWAGQLADAALGVKQPPINKLAVFFITLVVLATAMRAIARMIVRRWLMPTEPTLVVGTGRIARRVVEKLAARPEYGIRVVGFVDDDPLTDHIGDAPVPRRDATSSSASSRPTASHRVILAFSRAGDSRGVDLVRRCNQVGVQVDVVPRLYEVLGSKTQVHELDGLPLVSLHAPRLPRSARFVKRALDIVVAAVMLTLLSPLFAYVALRIKLEAAGPGLLPPGAHRPARSPLPDLQVPLDVHGRGRAQGRRRSPQQARRGRPDDVQDPRGPAHHAVRPLRCASGRSTSCRS